MIERYTCLCCVVVACACAAAAGASLICIWQGYMSASTPSRPCQLRNSKLANHPAPGGTFAIQELCMQSPKQFPTPKQQHAHPQRGEAFVSCTFRLNVYCLKQVNQAQKVINGRDAYYLAGSSLGEMWESKQLLSLQRTHDKPDIRSHNITRNQNQGIELIMQTAAV
jgi:hypothetical protein